MEHYSSNFVSIFHKVINGSVSSAAIQAGAALHNCDVNEFTGRPKGSKIMAMFIERNALQYLHYVPQ